MKYACGLMVILFCVTAQACQQQCRSFCNKDDRSSMMGSMRSNLVRLGDSIENTEAPVVGKLGNILPFAIVGFCLQKLPEQTMMVLGGLLLYVLFNSDTARNKLYTQEKVESVNTLSKNKIDKRKNEGARAIVESDENHSVHISENTSINHEDSIFSDDIAVEQDTQESEQKSLTCVEAIEPAAIKRPLSFL